MEKTTTLTASNKFIIDTMVKKINDDWTNFCKEVQKEIDSQYNRIGDQAKHHSETGFIQQQIDRIEVLKKSVEEARRTRTQRHQDLDKIELLLESKN